MEESWRSTIGRALDWAQAHVPFEAATAAMPEGLRGRRPDGFAHSAWELVEHIRLTQGDLVAYMEEAGYEAPSWPDDYWPPSPEPPNAGAWDDAVAAVAAGVERMRALLARDDLDPTVTIPWAEKRDHSYLRTVLVALDHAAYHVGQIVQVRRALSDWPPG